MKFTHEYGCGKTCSSTPSLDPDKWKDMFFKPVVDIRDFVQRKVRSTRRKRRCDSPSKNFVFITDEFNGARHHNTLQTNFKQRCLERQPIFRSTLPATSDDEIQTVQRCCFRSGANYQKHGRKDSWQRVIIPRS